MILDMILDDFGMSLDDFGMILDDFGSLRVAPAIP